VVWGVQVRDGVLGGGVMVVSHRCSVGLQVDTARVPSSQRVCRRFKVFSS